MTAKRFTECEYYNDDDCLNVNVIGYCSNPVRHKKIKGIALLHCQGSACELDTKDKWWGFGMTEKRYFKRMWEEEYYIFDSNTISESDFEEKLEYQNYKAFEDSMMGDEVVNRLNEQHETIQRLKQNITELSSVNVEEDLLKENEQLKQEVETLHEQLAHFGDYE